MAENLRLDPDALERVASNLKGAGERFSEAVADLRSGLAGTEGCWGDDEIGKSFDKKYRDPAEQSQCSAGELEEVAAGLPVVLRDVAEALLKVDQDSARILDHTLADDLRA
ncbi:WXG100 family type VII secretion target [Amycolatopsis japonica]